MSDKLPDTLIALRVAPGYWLDPHRMAELLRWLGTRPGTVDEIALFSSFTHPPLPIDVIASRCERLAEAMPQVREGGYTVGVNVLATIGHHEENLPGSLSEPWTRATDPRGRVCLGSYCPTDLQLLHYVEELYTLVAAAGPDFIWIDDDVRLMGHMPVGATCFCDRCIERFNREAGCSHTRGSLSAAMNGTPAPERERLRLLWLDHNRRVITELLRTATEAVHRVSPGLPLGFMTGDRFYEGYAFEEWAETLEGPHSPPPRWRPGGGFYSDERYIDLIDKANAIGRQVSQLPPRVSVIQSEIENFPYQRLDKSAAITVLEGIAHMAAGASGLALNVIGEPEALDDEYTPFLDGVQRARSLLETLREAAGRSPCEGFWPAWNRDIYADRGLTGDWPNHNQSTAALELPYVLGHIGIPIAYSSQGASASILAGPLPRAFSAEELERIFSGGVLLDGEALAALEDMGLGGWAGVRIAETFDVDAIEVFTDHPLNGGYTGWHRDCRQSFWRQPAYRLEPIEPGVETLARIADYRDNDLGPCMTSYENPQGGRVVVMGYSPWQRIYNLCKTMQLKAICQWLSRDHLPAVIETYAKVVVWARRSTEGKLVLVIINVSLDPISELVLRARSRGTKVACRSMSEEQYIVTAEPDGSEHVRVRIPDVAPWSAYLLLWQD